MRTLLQEAARGVTPGAVLDYGDINGALEQLAVGTTADADLAAVPVTVATIYDIASITKPIVAAVLMRAVAEGHLELDQLASRWLPELTADGAQRIQLAHLVGHASGLPAHVELFRRLWAGESAHANSRHEALIRMAAATPLAYEPGTRALYSDLGMILMGAVLERALGQPLDTLVSSWITEPLAMTSTRYANLDATPESFVHPVAPTERCPRRGLVHGEVHDENAHAGGGVFGHAGLFSSAGDLAAFARALLVAASGEHTGIFAPSVVRHFFTHAAAPDTTWRLGWDTPSRVAPSLAGDLWPREGVGHLGFTGCSIWLDPRGGRYVVLLSNRVHPRREREGIRELRRTVMDAAAVALGIPKG